MSTRTYISETPAVFHAILMYSTRSSPDMRNSDSSYLGESSSTDNIYESECWMHRYYHRIRYNQHGVHSKSEPSLTGNSKYAIDAHQVDMTQGFSHVRVDKTSMDSIIDSMSCNPQFHS